MVAHLRGCRSPDGRPISIYLVVDPHHMIIQGALGIHDPVEYWCDRKEEIRSWCPDIDALWPPEMVVQRNKDGKCVEVVSG